MTEMKGEQTSVLGNRPWIGMDVDKERFAAALYADPRPGTPDLRSMPTKDFTRDAEGVAACMEWAGKSLAKSRPGSPAPRVCMEATGRYSIQLAREILRQGPRSRAGARRSQGGQIALFRSRLFPALFPLDNHPAWEQPSGECRRNGLRKSQEGRG